MRFDVVCYPRLSAPGIALGGSAEPLPDSRRKFIVLVSAERCVIAIGPDLEPETYFHADLLRAASGEFDGLALRGGGHLRLSHDPVEGRKAWFHGRSTAFGPFDPVLRGSDARLALTKALGCPVAVA